MKRSFQFFSVLFILLFSISTFAQDDPTLEETLSGMSSDAAKAYVSPVISGFGSNLNAGWITGAPEAVKFGLTLNLRIVAMGSMFGDDDKSFSSMGTFRYTGAQADEILSASNITPSTVGSVKYNSIKNELLGQDWQVNLSGPTVIGAKDEYLQVEFPGAPIQGETVGQYAVEVAEVNGYLEDLSVLPMAAAQLNVGTVFGTNASFRYLPDIELGDLGKFSYFGFGLIHNPGVWMKNPLPVDVAVGFFTQTLKVGDVFESTANQYGLYVSKKFGYGISVTPYLGLTIESSTTTVAYDYSYDTPAGPLSSSISFDLEGDNSFGTTIGANFNLLILNLNVDYKLANINTFSAGISFGIH